MRDLGNWICDKLKLERIKSVGTWWSTHFLAELTP
jgi:hypothetical protein